MRESTWHAIEAIFETAPMLRAEQVSLNEIAMAAQELGLPFDADYREFISRYGGAIVGPYPIFGLRRAEPMGKNEASVVEVTRRFQQKGWPGTDRWVVFSIDHAGNPIGFDAEGKVWISDHDHGGIQATCSSFEEFIRRWCLKLDR